MWNGNESGKRIRHAATMVACVLAVIGGFASTARANKWNEKTAIMFTAPVEVPGRVLLPGTYVFKLLNSNSNRDIVQIFNKDQTRLYATILGMPDYRLTTPNNTIIRFEERASNSPEALRAWFYPGDNYGILFVYPHKRAQEIARRTGQSVLSMRDEMTKNITAPAKSANDESVKEMEKAEVTPVKPSGENGTANDALTSSTH